MTSLNSRNLFIGYLLSLIVILSNLPLVLGLFEGHSIASILSHWPACPWTLCIIISAFFYFVITETDYPQFIRQSGFLRLQGRLAYISLYFLALVLSGLFNSLPRGVGLGIAVGMCAWGAFTFAYATWKLFEREAK